MGDMKHVSIIVLFEQIISPTHCVYHHAVVLCHLGFLAFSLPFVFHVNVNEVRQDESIKQNVGTQSSPDNIFSEY